ncbi:MAG: DUF971 domain-containing protein [Sandaracinaceae bacterium]|nr:DUF971 domain-containing protein [Sandaracinaceae bacterium]
MTADAPTPATSPVELRAPIGAVQLEIDWEDGATTILPHRYLRGFCPCAGCQGHSGPISFMDGGDLRLVDVSEVGQYAIKLIWGDGHNTGLYGFAYLRALGEACREDDIMTRTFPR